MYCNFDVSLKLLIDLKAIHKHFLGQHCPRWGRKGAILSVYMCYYLSVFLSILEILNHVLCSFIAGDNFNHVKIQIRVKRELKEFKAN